MPPKNWSVFDTLGILMPGSDSYFLEVSAQVSLKVATKGSFTGKALGGEKTEKRKQRNATKKI